MKQSDVLLLAWQMLKKQRLRSALTILGIAIGIAIVIAIMAASRGLDNLIVGELDAYSPDLISIEIKLPSVKQTSNENAIGQAQGVSITTMKNSDIELVAGHPNIVSAYGMQFSQNVVSYAGQTRTSLIVGEGSAMPEVEKFALAAGRMFTAEEERSLAQVVLLGATVKESLFGEDSALNKNIHIKGRPFRVVGVAAERGSAFFVDMDNVVIMPTMTLQKKLLGIDYLNHIMARMRDRSKTEQTVADLEAMIRAAHNISDPNKDDFAINTMAQAKAMLGAVVAGVTFLLVALVCISLVVGGVGIMNIMYVSVAERTFEIGLRKAVGAKNSDIMRQFLSEAVFITLVGGVAGILLGSIFSLLIYWFAIVYGLDWIYVVPFSAVILAVTFSAFIGFLFGLYPARRAANLNPIDALRNE